MSKYNNNLLVKYFEIKKELFKKIINLFFNIILKLILRDIIFVEF